ncbi:MAG: Translation initiation factor IF-1 [Microgenomates group bacterium ADurb.Bin219]|nr:MAG: Translation initiation factor IF-1 [Microgenomates group bacterium ADurb.Bin219]HNP89200.1 translation initiation factor IF-1 [Candidatus Woesebacteria bacterium]
MVQKGISELDGFVLESLPNANFKVEIGEGKVVLCHVSGKMRLNHIRIMPGDRVKLEMTPYDQNRGRIVYKYNR